jgi:hypothetical protein
MYWRGGVQGAELDVAGGAGALERFQVAGG